MEAGYLVSVTQWWGGRGVYTGVHMSRGKRSQEKPPRQESPRVYKLAIRYIQSLN